MNCRTLFGKKELIRLSTSSSLVEISNWIKNICINVLFWRYLIFFTGFTLFYKNIFYSTVQLLLVYRNRNCFRWHFVKFFDPKFLVFCYLERHILTKITHHMCRFLPVAICNRMFIGLQWPFQERLPRKISQMRIIFVFRNRSYSKDLKFSDNYDPLTQIQFI